MIKHNKNEWCCRDPCIGSFHPKGWSRDTIVFCGQNFLYIEETNYGLPPANAVMQEKKELEK